VGWEILFGILAVVRLGIFDHNKIEIRFILFEIKIPFYNGFYGMSSGGGVVNLKGF
jgi:hypothetical protein